MLSNVEIYFAIAREAHAEMKRLEGTSRRSKPDGSPGHVVTYDPARRSLKQAMIAIAFSGMYFEAAVYLVALKKFPEGEARKIDRLPYEERLRVLGIADRALLDGAQTLREARKELVHEKALSPAALESVTFGYAQEMADHAWGFINQLHGALTVAGGAGGQI